MEYMRGQRSGEAMSRIIQCDRCFKTIAGENYVYRIMFSPWPKGIANSKKEYEVCGFCYDCLSDAMNVLAASAERTEP